jgi:putative ABC transport system permease protein
VGVALGARPEHVLRLIMSSGMALVASGLAIGIAAAIMTTRLLGSLVFGVSAIDPASFAAAAVVLVAVAAAAHLVPAMRALAIDPAAALRHD